MLAAAVTCGVYLGWNAPWLASPTTRLQLFPVWETLVFLFNAALFTLLGLQLIGILDDLSGFSAGTLIGYSLLVGSAVAVTRIVWVFASLYAPKTARHRRDGLELPSPRAGSSSAGRANARRRLARRGLGDPADDRRRGPVPGRALIIFLTFMVILGTLVFQASPCPG